MTSNPYQPSEPNKNSPTRLFWAAIAVGSVLAIGVMVAFVSKAMEIYDKQRFSDSEFDDSLRMSQEESRSPVRQKTAKAVFADNLPPGKYVSRETRLAVEQSLDRVFTEINESDDSVLGPTFDRVAFSERVRESHLLSPSATFAFSQFDDWYTPYAPFRYGSFQLVAVVSDDASADVLAYTLVNAGGDSLRIAWRFRSRGSGFLLVDYEQLSHSELLSENVARDFSAAFVSYGWSNYLDVIDGDLSGRDAARELRRLSSLTVPDSVQYSALVSLIETARNFELYDDALGLLDRLDAISSLPFSHLMRARVYLDMEQYEDVPAELLRFENLVGPGADIEVLRARVFYGTDQNEKGIEAALAAIERGQTLDHIPVQSLSLFRGEHAERIADVARSHDAPFDCAARFASRLMDYDRSDLAATLFELLDLPGPRTRGRGSMAAIHFLNSLQAEAADDRRSQRKHLALAMKATGKGQHEYRDYFYRWLYTHEVDEYAEAVRNSTDPVEVIFELAIDEDSILMIKPEIFSQMIEALRESSSDSEMIQERIGGWEPVLTAFLMLEEGNPDEALNRFIEVHQSSRASVIRDDDYGYWVPYWVASAAVLADRMGECEGVIRSFDFEPETLLFGEIESHPSEARCQRYCEMFPQRDECSFFKGLKAELAGDSAMAIKRYLEYVDVFEPDDYQIHMPLRRIGDLVCQDSDFKASLNLVPRKWWTKSVGAVLQGECRVKELSAMLKQFPYDGSEAASVIDLRSWVLEFEQDWQGLVELYEHTWQRDRDAKSKRGASVGGVFLLQGGLSDEFLTPATRERFFLALIKTNRLDDAQRYMGQLASLELIHALEWEIRLSIARQDAQRLRAAFGETEIWDRSSYNDEYMGAELWADVFQDVRDEYPPDTRDLLVASSYRSGLTLLFKGEKMLSNAELRTHISSIDGSFLVNDLTMPFRDSARLVSHKADASDLQVMFPGTVHRVSSSAGSWLIFQCRSQINQGPYFQSERSSEAVADGLPAVLSDEIKKHRMWMHVQLESVTPGATSMWERMQVARITGTLVNHSSLALERGYAVEELTDIVHNSLNRGQMKPSGTSWSSLGVSGVWFDDYCYTDSHRHTEEFVRRFQPDSKDAGRSAEAAKSTNNRESPKVVCALFGHGRLRFPLKCEVISVKPSYRPNSLVIRLPDSPLLPELYHGAAFVVTPQDVLRE